MALAVVVTRAVVAAVVATRTGRPAVSDNLRADRV